MKYKIYLLKLLFMAIISLVGCGSINYQDTTRPLDIHYAIDGLVALQIGEVGEFVELYILNSSTYVLGVGDVVLEFFDFGWHYILKIPTLSTLPLYLISPYDAPFNVGVLHVGDFDHEVRLNGLYRARINIFMLIDFEKEKENRISHDIVAEFYWP